MSSLKPYLIIDAYNVIYALDSLKAFLSLDVEVAKNKLLRMVASLHDGGDMQAVVVFDGKGPELSIELYQGSASFEVIHTPAHLTADTVIEQLVIRHPEPDKITVVSKDMLVVESIAASGAQYMSPLQFEEWVEHTERQIQTQQRIRQSSANQNELKNGLF